MSLLRQQPRNIQTKKIMTQYDKAKRAHHWQPRKDWWARRKSAFAHPTKPAMTGKNNKWGKHGHRNHHRHRHR
jgi:hypothetical protein